MSKVCVIIPFTPERLPIWVPACAILVEDGGKAMTYLDREDGKRVPPNILNHLERQGFGRNVNRAAELAWTRGFDYALIWNSDARPSNWGGVSEAWLGALSVILDNNPGVAAVAPVRRAVTAETSHMPSFDPGKGEVILYYEPTSGGAMGILGSGGESPVVWGMGYAPLYMVRLEAFLAVGGHDDIFAGGFYEDADMWIKLRRNGWGTVVAGDGEYVHGSDAEGGSETYRKLYPPEVIMGQGKRALRLLLTKYGIYPPLSEPLRLAYLDHRRRREPGEDAAAWATRPEATFRDDDGLSVDAELGSGELDLGTEAAPNVFPGAEVDDPQTDGRDPMAFRDTIFPEG